MPEIKNKKRKGKEKMQKNGKGVSRVLIFVLAVVLFFAISAVGKYNGLVKLDEEVKNAWANVEAQYQRRADLIPNLMETVKGYAKHEESVLTDIAKLRAGYQAAKTPDEYTQLDQELSKVINVAVEAYPDLKASENFLQFQDELAGTENRIAVSRRDYNEAVMKFNKNRRRFPNNIYAGIFGFEEKVPFKAAPGSEYSPQVKF